MGRPDPLNWAVSSLWGRGVPPRWAGSGMPWGAPLTACCPAQRGGHVAGAGTQCRGLWQPLTQVSSGTRAQCLSCAFWDHPCSWAPGQPELPKRGLRKLPGCPALSRTPPSGPVLEKALGWALQEKQEPREMSGLLRPSGTLHSAVVGASKLELCLEPAVQWAPSSGLCGDPVAGAGQVLLL